MSPDDPVRVKISSEAAESIALTPVVSQEMNVRELIRYVLPLTGKDAERVAELLTRGSLVSGGSRFRWSGLKPSLADVDSAFQLFPDPEPSRRFDPARCIQVTLQAEHSQIVIAREVGAKKRLFRRRNFWDMLLELAHAPRYVQYSYKEEADHYRVSLDATAAEALRAAARLLAYSTLERRVQGQRTTFIDLLVQR
ncbi:MAG TPA: hypothetical protein VMZ52_08245 [Bryobacteraceae bacterium]|nr:hypothetical protein [Bryobacteraceae bacterium]